MNRLKRLSEYGFQTQNRTYVIAEIGINHGGDIEIAKQLIESASRAGVDAVKFQTYKAEKRAPEGKKDIFEILKQCELPFDAFTELKNFTEKCEIDFFSTPFDSESVSFLETIDCSMYKLASFDVVNRRLINRVAKTGKSVIMSVGMSTLLEIEKAYDILMSGTNGIAILHCISAYPTEISDANLSAIYVLQEKFDCVIGQSDHTKGIMVPLYAVAAGAQIIEKHFMINDKMQCVDSAVSITEVQMAEMVQRIREIESIFGDGKLGMSDNQQDAILFRRYTS